MTRIWSVARRAIGVAIVATAPGVAAAQDFTVTISPVPSNGMVTNDDQSLRCGSDGSRKCSAKFKAGTKLHFWGDATNGYAIDTWSGCAGISGGNIGQCNLTVNGNTTISATFKSVGTKTVTVASPTGGTIRWNGYTCPGKCSGAQSVGDDMGFTAVPANGYQFASWTGVCAGKGDQCSLRLTHDISVGATFTNIGTYTITVSPMPSGVLITDDEQRIRCGYDGSRKCSATFTKGASVHFWGDVNGGKFGGWQGDCASQSTGVGSDIGQCTLRLNSDKTISAAKK